MEKRILLHAAIHLRQNVRKSPYTEAKGALSDGLRSNGKTDVNAFRQMGNSNFRSWTHGKHIFPSVQCLHQSMQLKDRRERNFPMCPSYEQSPDKWKKECIKESLVIFSNI